MKSREWGARVEDGDMMGAWDRAVELGAGRSGGILDKLHISATLTGSAQD